MTLTELECMASRQLDTKVTLKYPYKVCDIRPAYGLIFADLILGYDFWGYCDADVIWGNIRTFMTADILSRYSIISPRPDFLPGYFVLYKNKKNTNEFFKRSLNFAKVFAGEKYYNFDECNDKHLQVNKGQLLGKLNCEIESMTYLLREKCDKRHSKVIFDLMSLDFLPGKMFWNKGTLTYDERFEILLFHLLQYKRTEKCVKPEWHTVPDQFYINCHSFSLEKETFPGKVAIAIS